MRQSRFASVSLPFSFPLAFLVLLSFLLSACDAASPVCAPPYIANGPSCCMDKDNDAVCDAVAPLPGSLDCSLCPPQFVTQKEEVVVYRYVCPNGSVMRMLEQCGTLVVSNAHLFSPNTEQDDTYIASFSSSPACRGSFHAAEVHLSLNKVPLNITLEFEDGPDAMPRSLAVIPGKDDLYWYVAFCDMQDCAALADASLPPDTAYLIRAVLRYPERTVVTRDLVLDPTPEGEYGKKRCS